MVTDHEAVLAGLKAFITSKPHHGSKDITMKIAELEAEHRLDESAPEKALRQYGVQLHEDLRSLARNDPPNADGGLPADDVEDDPGDRPHQQKESIEDASINREGEPRALRT